MRERLTREIAHWDRRAEELRLQERAGKASDRLNAENARSRRDALSARLDARLAELKIQAALSSEVPIIRSMALVIPSEGGSGESESPYEAADAAARRRVEMAAVAAVCAVERRLGNDPVDVSDEGRGYDIESRLPDGHLRFIEVKGRISRADEVTITTNEIYEPRNEPERFVLAVVLIADDKTEVFYTRHRFEHEPNPGQRRATFAISALIEGAERMDLVG